MRILIRSELYLPTLGGVQSHVHCLARGLVQRGHEVCVLTARQSRAHPREEVIDGVRVVRTPGFGIGDRGLVGGILCGMPAFWRMAPEFDLWHSHVLFAAVPAALCRMFGRGRPHVVTVHTSRFLRMANSKHWHPSIRWLLHASDAALAMSHEIRDVAHRLVPEVPIEAMVNAVDTERFCRVEPRWIPAGSGPAVVCPRRLVYKNGVDVLVEAWPRVRERVPATLYVIGIGEEDAALRRRVRELGCEDSVMFQGGVQLAEMPSALCSGDVAVIPSRVEATSVAALEAMACERPIVSTDVGGLPEIIDGEVGRLVPSEDPAALAAALVEVLQLDPAQRAQLGRQGRRRVEQHWSIDAFARAHEAVYERAMAAYHEGGQ